LSDQPTERTSHILALRPAHGAQVATYQAGGAETLHGHKLELDLFLALIAQVLYLTLTGVRRILLRVAHLPLKRRCQAMAPPTKPTAAPPHNSAWWRAHVNLTNVVTALFLGYMSYTMVVLYRVAVPSVPGLTRADGSAKPALRPYWAEARGGLELELVLSTSPQRGGPDAAKVELLALRGGRRALGFDWDGLAGEVDLSLQLVRDAGGSETQPGGSGDGRVTGLRLTCRRDGTVSPRAAALCSELAGDDAGGSGSHRASGGGTAPGPGIASGLLAAVRRLGALVAASVGGGGAPAPSPPPPTALLGEWHTPAAVKVGRALTRGGSVYVHAALAWAGQPALPPHMTRHLLLPGTAADGGAVAAVPASVASAAAAAAAPFDPLKVATTTTRLVGDADYVAPRPLRHLWADPTGSRTPPVVDANGTVIDGASALAVKGGGSGGGGGSGDAVPGLHPTQGRPWPHWLGQLSLYAVTSLEALPRDELPPAMRAYVRADPTRTLHVPLLAANPVRPTRDHLAPLNGSLTELPLKVTLAPAAVGKWQLLSLLDASITTQHKMGATDKDTDDLIRMLAETPLLLLGITFVVSIVHLLFDALSFKHDVAFWRSASSLRGISVSTLTHTLVSNAVISLYLWAEGSSLLVTLPQAANTLLCAWKLAKAAGITWSLRWWVLPVPAYDAALHASATRGAASSADAEAVRYVNLLLAPFLAGYALYSFVFHTHTGWGEWALTTAVTAVYGAGFALMTPQLYINWRLRSVAHLPWKVLGYRFVNTVIDDLFAGLIRMPL
jgi:hypothetical protein